MEMMKLYLDLLRVASKILSNNMIAIQRLKKKEIHLGFTFSFPVIQDKIDSGKLLEWTKGFKTQGVVGNDVVALLNVAFEREKVNAKIVALANDTVGTMMTNAYKNKNCEMGLILGTGTNACYIEKTSNITKMDFGSKKPNEMIINIEWGAFGDNNDILQRTTADDQVDQTSLNPGRQKFEKMISGMYLGNIAKFQFLELVGRGVCLKNQNLEKFKESNFETKNMTEILLDKKLTAARRILKSNDIESTIEDLRILYQVCEAVGKRAAQLSAIATVAVLKKIGRLQNSIVAVDGSVFSHFPNFKEIMNDTIKEIEPSSSVSFVETKDGSGVGAAIIAAVADLQKKVPGSSICGIMRETEKNKIQIAIQTTNEHETKGITAESWFNAISTKTGAKGGGKGGKMIGACEANQIEICLEAAKEFVKSNSQ